MTTFFRLLKDTDKASALGTAIARHRTGNPDNERTFTVQPDKFRKIPNTPFAYWVDDSIRDLFVKLPSFESDGRTVKQGLATADDFRFVRAWWEVDAERRLDPVEGGAPDWHEDLEGFQKWCRNRTHQGKYWVPFAKGGEYSPYYSDIHLVVNWRNEGEEMKAFSGSVIRNPDYYFRPGVTWPSRTTSGWSPQLVPAGGIFSHKGYQLITDRAPDVLSWCGAFNTRLYQGLLEVFLGYGDQSVRGSAARDYTVGAVQLLPVLDISIETMTALTRVAGRIYRLRTKLSASDETQMLSPLASSSIAAKSDVDTCVREIRDLASDVAQVESVVRSMTGLGAASLQSLISLLGDNPYVDRETRRVSDAEMPDLRRLWETSIEQLIYRAIDQGWNTRSVVKRLFFVDQKLEVVAAAVKRHPADVVESLKDEVVQEVYPAVTVDQLLSQAVGVAFGRWRAENDSLVGSSVNRDNPLDPVPTRVAANDKRDDQRPHQHSLLVSDADHERSILRRVSLAVDSIFSGVAAVTDWDFRRAVMDKAQQDIVDGQSFFAVHYSQYCRSRRNAPIYWPLSTVSGSYTIWLYYPRLDETSLFTAYQLAREKYELLEKELVELQAIPHGERTKQQQKRFDEIVREVGEVHEFAEEILRITKLPYKPDHDDGVPICAAPLYKLFRHKPWSKYLQGIWEDLDSGKYDWAHLAYAIWPDRVREKAREDKSIAIAHRLESEA